MTSLYPNTGLNFSFFQGLDAPRQTPRNSGNKRSSTTAELGDIKPKQKKQRVEVVKQVMKRVATEPLDTTRPGKRTKTTETQGNAPRMYNGNVQRMATTTSEQLNEKAPKRQKLYNAKSMQDVLEFAKQKGKEKHQQYLASQQQVQLFVPMTDESQSMADESWTNSAQKSSSVFFRT